METCLARHDATLTARGLDLWFGTEPTFTDRTSFAPEWSTAAWGEDKQRRGRRLAAALAADCPGSVLLRSRGRQYPGEPVPRWSLGVYSRRDGSPLWRGPPDPLRTGAPPKCATDARILRQALADELHRAGHWVQMFDLASALGTRLLFGCGEEPPKADDGNLDPRVTRPPLSTLPIPAKGGADLLAAQGIHLLCLGPTSSGFGEDRDFLEVELPGFPDAGTFQRFLALLEAAAVAAGVPALILSGYPPPVDESVAWTSVTPDPGVVEVNTAPCTSAAAFLAEQRRLHALAEDLELSPFRWFYNGDLTDSGGGQHLTFGGPRPEASPFFLHPRLLPRLVAYANRHPSLSYWFAVRAVGSCGQQPRADEGSPEVVDGLAVAMDALETREDLTPELLWRSLAPFLTDRFGNSHRSEINVEKLWNPYLAERGRLGLVELRAFRMTRTPERAAAVAVLCRSILALLAGDRSQAASLRHWGRELHDRFSLPFYQRQDLQQVLAELRDAELGLGAPLEEELLDDHHLLLDRCPLPGVVLQVRAATEFWPVVGGGAGDGTYRLMDSSTARLELMMSATDPSPEALRDWRLVVDGFEIPWVAEYDGPHPVLLRGLRYKAFQPEFPVFPLVPARDPVAVTLVAPGAAAAYRLEVHGWQPEGLAYPGLPVDSDEARRRTAERVRLEPAPVPLLGRSLPPGASSPCCVDLRRLPHTP